MSARVIVAEEWRDQALCQADPELFFPERGRDTQSEALRVCAMCPVMAECMKWTLMDDASKKVECEINGICGGLTQRQRREVAVEAWRRNADATYKRKLAGIDVHKCAGGCGRLVYAKRFGRVGIKGVVMIAARGMCRECYARVREQERAEQVGGLSSSKRRAVA